MTVFAYGYTEQLAWLDPERKRKGLAARGLLVWRDFAIRFRPIADNHGGMLCQKNARGR